jgi:hypothetical protein
MGPHSDVVLPQFAKALVLQIGDQQTSSVRGLPKNAPLLCPQTSPVLQSASVLQP